MFAFRGDLFASEAQRWMPEIWRAAAAAARAARRTPDGLWLDKDVFASAPRMSLDYALLEKSDRVTVIPAAFEWSDVGNWASIHTALEKDDHGNATLGDVAARDTRGSLLIGNGVKLVAIGVDRSVVVTCAEGTFVAPLDRAAEVKALVEEKKSVTTKAGSKSPRRGPHSV
jgi:mannose-1-phosphate guanylyltransferase